MASGRQAACPRAQAGRPAPTRAPTTISVAQFSRMDE
ncbi:Uncharacterised protein [Bordetella pertussis]|nr:Uncharacterised protein [Bordetella pertussis]